MVWDKGFNFRATSGYVTDGTNETYELSPNNDYPQTRNGVTFGYISDYCQGIDRNSGNDRRLAGINYYENNGLQSTFRVDLPATGDYDIWMALGDEGNAATQYVYIYDDISLLQTVASGVSVASAHFLDATGTDYAKADWPSNNAKITKTFSTTTFILKYRPSSAQSGYSCVAHMFISQVVTSGVIYPQLERNIRGIERGLYGGF